MITKYRMPRRRFREFRPHLRIWLGFLLRHRKGRPGA
jgi:hypothetical protein